MREKVLLIADIQPDERDGSDNLTRQVLEWRGIRNQFIARHSDADWMIVAGDLVDRGVPNSGEQSSHYGFADFEADITRYMPKQKIFVTAGNHDFGYPSGQQNLNAFLSWWPNSRTYYVVRGNFLWIFMGDEEYGTSGELGTDTFNWWKALVEGNTDKNIITVTHQPLDATTAGAGTSNGWRIVDSSRFTDILEGLDNHVVWISGHNAGVTIAQRGLMHRTVDAHVQKHGTWHVNVGLHTNSYFEDNPLREQMSYCTWHIEQGATAASIRRWDAMSGDEVTRKRFSPALKYPAVINPGVPDFDSRN